MNQKGFSPLVIILGIILIIGIAGGAYYFGKSQTKKPEASSSPNPMVVSQTPQPIITPSSSPDETSSWKIYTNAKNGFSIKYPNNVRVGKENYGTSPYKGIQSSSGIIAVSLGIDTPKCIREGGNFCQRFIDINITDNPQGLSLNQIVDQEFSPSNFVLSRDFQKTTVDGEPALISLHGLPAQEYAAGIFTVHNKKLYSLIVSTFGETSLQNDEAFNLLKEMSSTFKFTQ